jgi:hypothetical protein
LVLVFFLDFDCLGGGDNADDTGVDEFGIV